MRVPGSNSLATPVWYYCFSAVWPALTPCTPHRVYFTSRGSISTNPQSTPKKSLRRACNHRCSPDNKYSEVCVLPEICCSLELPSEAIGLNSQGIYELCGRLQARRPFCLIGWIGTVSHRSLSQKPCLSRGLRLVGFPMQDDGIGTKHRRLIFDSGHMFSPYDSFSCWMDTLSVQYLRQASPIR